VREALLLIAGIGFLIVGFCILLGAAIPFDRILKNGLVSSWYQRTRDRWLLEEYIEERFSQKTKRTIEIIIGVLISAALIIIGLNVLLKGINDPYSPGFWVLF